MTRENAIDGLMLCAMLGIAYVTPARLRPALTLATAISLSRAHGRSVERVERVLDGLFDQRNALTPRVEKLERWAFGDLKAESGALYGARTHVVSDHWGDH